MRAPLLKTVGILLVAAVAAGCAGKTVTRVDSDTTIDLSGYWNDADSRLVSEEMIVDALAGGDQSVGRLTEMVGSDVSTVSRHLSVLKAVGIVTAHKQGNQVLYHLETPCVTDFFDCAMEVLRQTSQTQQRAISG